METANPHEITELLSRLSAGDRTVEDRVIRLLYRDLHHLAKVYLSRERPDHSLQPTALVDEIYMRITRQPGVNWPDRARFFAMAATAMRHLLVDHARGLDTKKREAIKVPLDLARFGSVEQPELILKLNEALDRLETWDPRQAQIVELKFFVGLKGEEIAKLLNIGTRTVKRDLNQARAWLYAQLTEDSEDDTR